MQPWKDSGASGNIREDSGSYVPRHQTLNFPVSRLPSIHISQTRKSQFPLSWVKLDVSLLAGWSCIPCSNVHCAIRSDIDLFFPLVSPFVNGLCIVFAHFSSQISYLVPHWHAGIAWYVIGIDYLSGGVDFVYGGLYWIETLSFVLVKPMYFPWKLCFSVLVQDIIPCLKIHKDICLYF